MSVKAWVVVLVLFVGLAVLSNEMYIRNLKARLDAGRGSTPRVRCEILRGTDVRQR